jgi:SAM-dependent methyltransferase
MSTQEADQRARQAGSFGAAADIYEQARPSYPQESIDFLLEGLAGDAKVIDLGAGTGKFTRLIAERGVDVTAVEPADGMREQLQRVLPDVAALKGTAEQLPLPDHSVDVVLAAQAWHWVDVPRASAEVARVLKAGGRLGLIWNRRDQRVDWVDKFSYVADHGRVHSASAADPDFGDWFEPAEHHTTEWEQPMTPQGLVDLAASRSYVIVASEAERTKVFDAIREFTRTDPQLAGRDQFMMPYVTYSSRARVKSS